MISVTYVMCLNVTFDNAKFPSVYDTDKSKRSGIARYQLDHGAVIAHQFLMPVICTISNTKFTQICNVVYASKLKIVS